MSNDKKNWSHFFLPDFCTAISIFMVMVLVEFLVFIFILSNGNQLAQSFDEFGLLSFYVQWLALANVGIVCLCRPFLIKFSDVNASVLAFILMMAMTVCLAFVAQLFMDQFSYQWSKTDATRDEFLLRVSMIAGIISAFGLRYFYVTHQWRRRIELEATAQMGALQSRIRPHFLFNSLNVIAALVTIDPKRAEKAIEELSVLFRAMLRTERQLVTFKEEMKYTQIYLNLEAIRMGDRLKVNWDVDLPMDSLILPLMLQPIVENAVNHGVAAIPEGGCIDIQAKSTNGQIILKVLNPLPLIKDRGPHEGNCVAVKNIQDRLNLIFGKKASFVAGPQSDLTQYMVEVRFPQQS